jgi:hypothetical protein
MDNDAIAQAIREAFIPRPGEGMPPPSIGSSLASIEKQLVRIADALEQLVELETEEEDEEDDDEDS